MRCAGCESLPWDKLFGTIETPSVQSVTPRVPKFSAISVDTPKLSLSGGEVGVKTNMGNPNKFALGLDDLGYELRLGDVSICSLRAATAEAIAAGEERQLSLAGSVQGIQAAKQLLKGVKAGGFNIAPTGFLTTPYGKVKAPKLNE